MENKRKAIATKAATEAWFQLVYSMISGTPPSDMEPDYYYAYLVMEESEQAHNNSQGIEHIQVCTRSSKHSDVVQVYEDQNQQGIKHVPDCMRSANHYDVVQASEEANKHGIEHIQYCMRSTKHYGVLQESDQEYNQQGIEHIQNLMISAMHYEVVQENEHGNQQQVEGTQDSIRSPLLSKPREYDEHQEINNILETGWSDVLKERTCVNQQRINRMQAHMLTLWFDKLLDLVEDGDLQRKEKLILDPKVVCLIKLLHHYGVNTIRSGVDQELENLNQKHVNTEKDLEIQYKKKGLELMLRICDNEMCQKTIYQIIGKAEMGQVVYDYGE